MNEWIKVKVFTSLLLPVPGLAEDLQRGGQVDYQGVIDQLFNQVPVLHQLPKPLDSQVYGVLMTLFIYLLTVTFFVSVHSTLSSGNWYSSLLDPKHLFRLFTFFSWLRIALSLFTQRHNESMCLNH